MKRSTLVFASTLLAFGLTGCVNPDGSQNNTGSGALMGGAIGAIGGTAIGGSAHGGQDALIGAAVGALAGGLIGNAADREQETRLRAQAPLTYTRVEQRAPLSVADVKALAKAGVSDGVMISQISVSRTVFRLSAADIIGLRDSGVSNPVVTYMINTRTRPLALKAGAENLSDNTWQEHGAGKLREPAAKMAALPRSAGFQPAGSGGILPPVSHFQTGFEAMVAFGGFQ